MSLSRVALRLTTLEALAPTGASSFPTLAELYVYDSKLDPIDDLAPAQRRPVAVVYTEFDNGEPGQKAGGPPFKRYVDLTIELAIVAAVGEGADYQAGVPQTDDELEASLDLLEAQVRFVLFFGPTGALWRKLTGRKVTDIKSLPHRTSEEAVRLAMRTLTLKTEVPDDCFDAAPSAEPQSTARLPQPLRDVIDQLAESSYGKKIGLGLSELAPVMPVATPFDGIALTIKSMLEMDIDMVDVSVEIESALAIPTAVSDGSPVVFDYRKGHYAKLILAADVAAISVINWAPAGKTSRLILEIINTGSFDIAADAWPAGTAWPSSIPPTVTHGAGKRDLVILTTVDNGASIIGSLAAQDLPPA